MTKKLLLLLLGASIPLLPVLLFGQGTVISPCGIRLFDEGISVGCVPELNAVGSGIVATVVGGRGILTVAGGGGGGGNFVEAEVDFGAAGNTTASVVVTGQAWVSATSNIVCAPTMFSTADRDDGDEDALIEGLTIAVHTRVASTGFTVMAHPENGVSYGKFKVHCTGS